MALTDLYPYVGRLHQLTDDLYIAGAEFFGALGRLDRGAYDDVRPHFDVEEFNMALATIEKVLAEFDTALGVDPDQAARR